MSEATTWMVSLGRHGFLVSVIVLLFLEWMTDGPQRNSATIGVEFRHPSRYSRRS